MKVKIIKD